jgi:hypothetical protein
VRVRAVAAGDVGPGRFGGDPGRLRPPPKRPGCEVLREEPAQGGRPCGETSQDGTSGERWHRFAEDVTEKTLRCRERHGDVTVEALDLGVQLALWSFTRV